MKKIAYLFLATLIIGLPACHTLPKKANREIRVKKEEKKGRSKPAEPKRKDMPDAAGDVAFQAFVGRLRHAVAAHDVAELASMMTSNFGYSLAPLGEGDGVFRYWDENGLWQELQSIVNDNFVVKGDYMVSPGQFAADPNYRGYRAGLTRIGGSWKFAYFVSG